MTNRGKAKQKRNNKGWWMIETRGLLVTIAITFYALAVGVRVVEHIA